MIVSLKPTFIPKNKCKRMIYSNKRLKIKNQISLSDAAELTGKFLGAFVLFTSTLNWMMYRRINKQIEENDKK
ncbi:MAG: hypothetical protein EBU66_19350 [Bacteroidetes bacterium]|nr:hypothetical protein [Bacteroidota bacterium]